MLNPIRHRPVPLGPIEVGILRRAVVLWLLIRGTVGALQVGTGAHPLWLHPKAALILIAAVGFLSWLDVKRRNEDILLANLGTSSMLIHALAVGPMIVAEAVFGVVSRL